MLNLKKKATFSNFFFLSFCVKLALTEQNKTEIFGSRCCKIQTGNWEAKKEKLFFFFSNRSKNEITNELNITIGWLFYLRNNVVQLFTTLDSFLKKDSWLYKQYIFLCDTKKLNKSALIIVKKYGTLYILF